ncbi:MAG: DUF1232 domain-containing protein [Verrucomicrobia bacterium]|nr:DUF1232 domain-containing protein [Verrucomicrobiota bacterium]MBU4291536.1 DUF1232 domain-containing protein [Verrucomicrobiota bacterium]MBU4429105.1 DUF1232 domain-containing protein [Verrucomicrobiota bacterium]
MKDQRTPRRAKWFVWLALAYVVSPFDLIPDFIPGVGWLDELVVVPILLGLARVWIPAEVLADCRTRAEWM